MNKDEIQFHPIADLFPMMSQDEAEVLCLDIAANGQREPILMAVDEADGKVKIADGRNRYRACMSVNVEPQFRMWDGEGSLRDVVVSLNLKRRHLSESQRAMVAAKLAKMERGRPETNPSIEGIITQDKAASALNVSVASVERASKVQKQGIPELVAAVEADEISVSMAATIASMSPKKQKAHIKRGRKAKKGILGKIKERSIRAAAQGKATCVVCGPDIEDTDSNFLAAVQFVSKQFPRHARYLTDIANELAEDSLLEGTLAGRNKILALIDDGVLELVACRQASGLPLDEFDHIKADLLYHKLVEIVTQGGKTEAARGARKELFRRTEKSLDEIVELTYEMDDDFPEKDVYLERW